MPIVTLSENSLNRNFTLGQDGDDYNVRLRTTTTGNNGRLPSVSSTNGEATLDLTHVVYTRDASGDANLYIDNELVTSANIGGNFSNWDLGDEFALANELTGDRPWLGSFDLVAIYDQALDAEEVEQNFLARSDASQTNLAGI